MTQRPWNRLVDAFDRVRSSAVWVPTISAMIIAWPSSGDLAQFPFPLVLDCSLVRRR